MDDFNRPDTDYGLGNEWDLRGPTIGVPTLPPATDGFIDGGRFSYSGDTTVYAVRQFRNIVRRVGAIGNWQQQREGAITTLNLAISANDNILSDIVSFAANPDGWNLSVRRANGSFQYVASDSFSPPLQIGRDYAFEIEASYGDVTVRVPGSTTNIVVGLYGLLGHRAIWGEFIPPGHSAGVVFGYDSVWAAEDGQELFPSPSPAE